MAFAVAVLLLAGQHVLLGGPALSPVEATLLYSIGGLVAVLAATARLRLFVVVSIYASALHIRPALRVTAVSVCTILISIGMAIIVMWTACLLVYLLVPDFPGAANSGPCALMTIIGMGLAIFALSKAFEGSVLRKRSDRLLLSTSAPHERVPETFGAF